MSFTDPGAIKLLMSKKGNEKYTHIKNKKKSSKVLRQNEKYSLLVLSSACQDKETSMESWYQISSCLLVIIGDSASGSWTLQQAKLL